MVTAGYGPGAAGEEGMAWRTTQHPQECRTTGEHPTFCNGSIQAQSITHKLFALPMCLICDDVVKKIVQTLQGQTCMGVLTLLISVPVADGKKAEHREEFVFVK